MLKKLLILTGFLVLVGCQNHLTKNPAPTQACTTDLDCTKKGAEDGDVAEQVILATRYNNGDGVPVDYKKAEYWYQKAADKGIPEAQYDLGNMYSDGRGVPKSDEQAFNWYLKAAKSPKGMAPAQFNVAFMYSHGVFVKQDEVAATKWYMEAASNSRDYRDVAAMASLIIGQSYYHGEGAPKDIQTAYAWFYFAKLIGNKEADRSLNIITNKMSKKQIENAQITANQLNEKYHFTLGAPFPVMYAKTHRS